MIGLAVQLAVSLIIIWLAERQHLSVLGFYPTGQRLKDFLIFFTIASLCCASGFLLSMWWGNEKWVLNPLFSGRLLWAGIWWNVKSVLFEELIFRGVLLYILIKRLGTAYGIIISSSAFGVYHWFSYGIWGNIPQMTLYFFITGIMGLVYAYGYAKTFSLYIPAAIHFGWNFTQSFVFSKEPIGKGLFVMANQQNPVTVSVAAYTIIFLLPLLSVWFICWRLLKIKMQAAMPGAAA